MLMKKSLRYLIGVSMLVVCGYLYVSHFQLTIDDNEILLASASTKEAAKKRNIKFSVKKPRVKTE